MIAVASPVVRLSRTVIELNVATRSYHAGADTPWLDLMVPGIEQPQYVAHLVKVYGFEAPLEAALYYTPGVASLIDLRARNRTGLLALDMLRLGVTPSQIAQLPQLFMAFSSATEALAWMYVAERSTLLHAGVRRYLALRLPEMIDALSYLSAYDGVPGDRWAELGGALDAVAETPAITRQLVFAASQAFGALRSWFHPPDAQRSFGT
jgi:heme oxygenase